MGNFLLENGGYGWPQGYLSNSPNSAHVNNYHIIKQIGLFILTSKLFIKYEFQDQIVNNIKLTQNLMCILKATKIHNPIIGFSKY